MRRVDRLWTQSPLASMRGSVPPFAMSNGPVAHSHVVLSLLFGATDVPNVRALLESMAPDQNLAILLLHDDGAASADADDDLRRIVGASLLPVVEHGPDTPLRRGTIGRVNRTRLTSVSEDLICAIASEPWPADHDTKTRSQELLHALTIGLGRRGCVIAFAGAMDQLPPLEWIAEALQAHKGLILVQPAPEESFLRVAPYAPDGSATAVQVPTAELAYAVLEHAEPLIAEQRPRDVSPLFTVVESSLDDVLQHVQSHVGHDFLPYRPATLVRRTIRRMHRVRAASVGDYVEQLRTDSGEAESLFRELLVGVTAFFRDSDVFEYLARHILSGLVTSERSAPARVWVAGCSTGEEVYTIAMLCEELSEHLPALRRTQFFASDVDKGVLDLAREGRYTPARAANLSPERLQRFFDHDQGGLRVKQWLRDRIVFARHNVLVDVPFSRIDLICCRNVLIYFQDHARARVLADFHRALRADGTLLLGPSETMRDEGLLFSPIDTRYHVYRRNDVDVPHELGRHRHRAASMHNALLTANGRQTTANTRTRTTALEHTMTTDGNSHGNSHGNSNGNVDGKSNGKFEETSNGANGGDPATRAIIARLEADLVETRAGLLRASDEGQAVGDELRSTIEELSAMNEELHSTVDELDRSKRELEIANRALSESNSELGHLLDNTGVPTIFIDSGGAIRRANPHAARIYNLRESDFGRPLEDFSHRAVAMPPMPLLSEVHGELPAIEHEVELHDGSTFLRRVRPYKNEADSADGLVVTFTDITERVKSLRDLRAGDERWRSVIDAMFSFVGLMAMDGTLLEANRAPLEVANLSRSETIGKKFWECGWFSHSETVRDRLFRAFERARAGELVRYDEEICVANDGRITIDFMLQPVFDHGKVRFLVPSGVDITERVAAEKLSRSQHALVNAITQNATTAIFVLDAFGRCEFANPASQRITGYSEAELLGQPLHQRLHPVSAVAIHNCIGANCPLELAALSQRHLRDFETIAVVTERRVIHVMVSAGPIDAPSGEGATVLEIRDVTESVKVQRDLKESEQRFRQLAEAIPQMAWIADKDGNIEWYNQRWYDYTGSTFDDVKDWGWTRFQDPDVLPTVLERWSSSIAAGSAFEMVFPILGADGQFRPFLTGSHPLRGEDGTIQLWFGTNTNISDERAQSEQLRRSEHRLRSITDALPDVLTRYDRHKRIAFANISMERFFGVKLTSIVGAKNWDLPMPTPICESIEAAIDAVFTSGQASTLQYALDTSKGLRRFDVLFTPELDAQGRVEFVLSFARDRTAELEAVEELQDAIRRKDQFLATLAHELRNPLAPLRSALEILRLSGDEKEQVEASRAVMQRQVANLTRLVEDLVDVSRIRLGKVALRTAWVDLRDVVNDALELTATSVKEQGHTLEVRGLDTAVVVDCDRTRIGQVLANLISNAVKYTHVPGCIGVTLGIDGEEAIIRVSDTGRGLASDELERVFAMFVQLPHTGTTTVGLGIGLALARQLVTLHGGTVYAESEGHGRGSTFTVRLPMLTTGSELPKSTPAAALDGVRPLHILVVDDNVDAAESLATVLQLLGHTAETVFTATAALAYVDTTIPDLVIADIGLPDLTGYELAEAFRLRPQMADVVLVALTGWGSDEHRRRSADSGFDYHLTKPVETEVLLRILARTALDTR